MVAGPCAGQSVTKQRPEPASSAAVAAEPVWPPIAKKSELRSKKGVFQGGYYLALSSFPPR